MRKRKTTYPPKRNNTRPAGDSTPMRSQAVEIDMTALTGKGAFRIGDRVRIKGTGFLAGEDAVVESVVGGMIPAASVRTAGGQSRRVRTIDLEPLPGPAEPEATSS